MSGNAWMWIVAWRLRALRSDARDERAPHRHRGQSQGTVLRSFRLDCIDILAEDGSELLIVIAISPKGLCYGQAFPTSSPAVPRT